MQALLDLGLTVVDEPVDELPGHAVIPELRVDAYDRNKLQLRDVLVELARLASQAIVHSPGTCP